MTYYTRQRFMVARLKKRDSMDGPHLEVAGLFERTPMGSFISTFAEAEEVARMYAKEYNDIYTTVTLGDVYEGYQPKVETQVRRLLVKGEDPCP